MEAATVEKSSPLTDIVYWIELLNGWGAIGILALTALTALLLWSLNRGGTAFKLGDALIDPMTGQASILRVAFFVCLLAAWGLLFFYAVQGKDVLGTMLGVLAIFVTPLITTRAFEVWDPRTKAQAVNDSPALAVLEAAKANAPVQPAAGPSSTTITATASTTEGKTP